MIITKAFAVRNTADRPRKLTFVSLTYTIANI